MPRKLESNIEQRLGPKTLCVLAINKTEYGGYSIVGMGEIKSGEFVSKRRLEESDMGEFPVADISRMSASGGEMFARSWMSLREMMEELMMLVNDIGNERNVNREECP